MLGEPSHATLSDQRLCLASQAAGFYPNTAGFDYGRNVEIISGRPSPRYDRMVDSEHKHAVLCIRRGVESWERNRKTDGA